MAKAKKKAKKKAAADAPAIAEDEPATNVDWNEAVDQAHTLYAQDDETRDDIEARLREIPIGEMPSASSDGDMVEIEDGEGVVVSTTSTHQYVLLND